MGAAVGSRAVAAVVGPALHLVGDRIPHRDIHNRRFEVGSGLLVVGLLAARRGPFDPATLGAVTTCAPDLEHLLRLPRPGGSKLFHGRRGWHRDGPLSARAQLLLASFLLARLLTGPAANRPEALERAL